MSNLARERDAEHAGWDCAWRSFLRPYLLTVLLLLVAIGTLNYVVNPMGLYDTHFVPQLLWGARPRKAAMLKALQTNPEALVLCSSRAMNLAPSEVQRATGLRTFNAGVDSAKAEDFYILLRYAFEEAHLHPKLLIIGLDVEAFHNHEPPHYYLQQPSLLASFLWRSQSQHWRWNGFTRLFSHLDTELSVEALYKTATGDVQPFSHVEPDGYTHWDLWEKERAAGQLNLQKEMQDTLDRFTPRYDDFTGPSQERLAYFDATLRYAHDHGMEAVVFLTPTHPAIEQGLAPHGYFQRKQEVTAALQQICSRWKTPFYDFSAAESFGGDASHFFDGVHYDDTMNPLILTRMFPVRARAIQ